MCLPTETEFKTPYIDVEHEIRLPHVTDCIERIMHLELEPYNTGFI